VWLWAGRVQESTSFTGPSFLVAARFVGAGRASIHRSRALQSAWEISAWNSCWSTLPCGCTSHCIKGIFVELGDCYPPPSKQQTICTGVAPSTNSCGSLRENFDGCACEVRIQLPTAGFLIELWEVFYSFSFVINPAIIV
jgi:hypothetical protein